MCACLSVCHRSDETKLWAALGCFYASISLQSPCTGYSGANIQHRDSISRHDPSCGRTSPATLAFFVAWQSQWRARYIGCFDDCSVKALLDMGWDEPSCVASGTIDPAQYILVQLLCGPLTNYLSTPWKKGGQTCPSWIGTSYLGKRASEQANG